MEYNRAYCVLQKMNRGESMPISFIELLIIAISLSMDAFAVSICKGLSFDKIKISRMLIVGLYFGGFQMLMPILGYFLGKTFASFIDKYDHWVVFALLSLIGANMIREALGKEEKVSSSLKFGEMILLAIATSIDALAVGISFALLGFNNSNIFLGTGIIGITTFIISSLGVLFGNLFGAKNRKIASIVGGSCLILLGIKILLSDLGVISF